MKIKSRKGTMDLSFSKHCAPKTPQDSVVDTHVQSFTCAQHLLPLPHDSSRVGHQSDEDGKVSIRSDFCAPAETPGKSTRPVAFGLVFSVRFFTRVYGADRFNARLPAFEILTFLRGHGAA